MTTAPTMTTPARQMAGDSASLDVLLFTNGFALFGLPSDPVLEILYPHPVTPLPFVSPAIDGLINVEGRIAVQVNLGTLSDFPSSSARNELLLIDTGRALCALKVDSVLSRASLPRNESSTTLPDTLAPALRDLAVNCKRWMGNTVIMLDPARLGRLVRPEGLSEEGMGILGKVTAEDTRADNSRNNNASTHCLVVETAGERYALPLDTVVEIVEGEACTPIPGAPAAINGLFLLRDDVILMVDLATRLGRQRQQTDQHGWFVVLDHAQGRCGFAFEQVIEIEQFANNRFQAATDPDGLVKGLFVGDSHNTLLLHPDALVDEQIRTILATHHALPGQQRKTSEDNLRFLHVEIGGTPYAIPVETVKRVTPCFAMESTVDTSGRIRGAIDLDGQIIPVLELGYGLSLPQAVAEKEYVVIGDGTHDWAFGVDTANRIVSVPRTQVNRLTRSDARYVGGVVQIDERLVSLLDFSVLSTQHADDGDH